jgi:hypothetical protein
MYLVKMLNSKGEGSLDNGYFDNLNIGFLNKFEKKSEKKKKNYIYVLLLID